MNLYNARSALNTFEFILSNGRTFTDDNTNNNRNELTDYDKNLLSDIVQTYTGKKTLNDLIIKFFRLSNIYLQIIAFNEGQFEIINTYFFPSQTKLRKQAFIVLNGDFTICGPLCTADSTGKIQTVFDLDDMSVKIQVGKYIDKLNQTDRMSFPRIQETPISTTNQNISDEMLINDISVLVNDLNTEILDPPTNTIEIHTFYDQITEHTTQTNNKSPTIATIQFATQEPATSFRLSNNMQDSSVVPISSLTQVVYEEPKIVVQPKSNWKSRYPKDLISKSKKEAQRKPNKEPKYKRGTRKQTNKKENIKSIGLLQGTGNQRSRIQVEVPRKVARKMYLAATVRTINNQRHSLKLIVPEKTKVNKDSFNRENDLNYFEFDECSPMHFFDLETSILYMEITSEEHEKKLKEVPIYMFNLYQNQRLTKEMIELEQLEKCKLAFWLCIKENENYKAVSKESYSCIITERKKKKQNYPP